MSEQKQTNIMKFVKSTKGTHVYGDSNDDAPISSVYVKRSSLPKSPPDEIEITINYSSP